MSFSSSSRRQQRRARKKFLHHGASVGKGRPPEVEKVRGKAKVWSKAGLRRRDQVPAAQDIDLYRRAVSSGLFQKHVYHIP